MSLFCLRSFSLTVRFAWDFVYFFLGSLLEGPRHLHSVHVGGAVEQYS